MCTLQVLEYAHYQIIKKYNDLKYLAVGALYSHPPLFQPHNENFYLLSTNILEKRTGAILSDIAAG
jgi:hypothetical protein